MTVPAVWAVALDALPVFVAVEDDRPRIAGVEPRDGPDLCLTGFVAFGGITVAD